MKDKLQQLHADISFRLNQIGEIFKEDEEVKITPPMSDDQIRYRAKETGWSAASGMPGYETRINSEGHKETRMATEQTLAFRCMRHRDVLPLNRNEASGAECPICAMRDTPPTPDRGCCVRCNAPMESTIHDTASKNTEIRMAAHQFIPASQEVPAEQRDETDEQWLERIRTLLPEGSPIPLFHNANGSINRAKVMELPCFLSAIQRQPASAAEPPSQPCHCAELKGQGLCNPCADMLSRQVERARDIAAECLVEPAAAKPAEDGLEEQLRACIRYTAARLRDEHEDLEEDIYAAVLNFIHLRERELRDSLAAEIGESFARNTEHFQAREQAGLEALTPELIERALQDRACYDINDELDGTKLCEWLLAHPPKTETPGSGE